MIITEKEYLKGMVEKSIPVLVKSGLSESEAQSMVDSVLEDMENETFCDSDTVEHYDKVYAQENEMDIPYITLN